MTTGTLALLGSGETSSQGRKIHDYLMARIGTVPVHVALLETPAGFQPNAHDVYQKIGAYIEKSLQNYRPQIEYVAAHRKESPLDGASWDEVTGLSKHYTRSEWGPGNGGLCLHTILVDPTKPQRMWIGISAVGVFRTDDGGVSWKVCNNGLPQGPTGVRNQEVGRCVHKIVLDPKDSNTLYCQFHGGVFKSTDAADSWQPIETGLPGNFGFPMGVTAEGDLFVIPLESDMQRHVKDGQLLVYRSRDGGQNWAPTGKGLPDQPHYVGVLRDALSVDSLNPAGVYFGTSMGEVFYSPDAGENWDRLPGQFPRITMIKAWVRDGEESA